MKDNRIPSPFISLLPVFVLILLLFVTIRVFGSDALSGGSQVCLLTATAVCVLIGMAGYRRAWKDFELAITNNIAGVSTALIILLIIGALSGAWMISGVVPTLIYYGIQVIHPHFFLVSTCVICAIVSVMTGSSWTTIATIGIALMGIGKAQGFSEGWIAGAIISGAYFGDKVSPLSDTTILASSVTDTPLFTHIRYLMITTIPSLVITLIIFTVAGLSHEATDTGHITEYMQALDSKFNISWWLMIVPVVTGVLIARKVPSVITLFISTTLATVFALIFQPDLLREIAGQGVAGLTALFKGGMGMLFGNAHDDGWIRNSLDCIERILDEVERNELQLERIGQHDRIRISANADRHAAPKRPHRLLDCRGEPHRHAFRIGLLGISSYMLHDVGRALKLGLQPIDQISRPRRQAPLLSEQKLERACV